MPDNPFQTMLNPNAARAGLWDLRLMSAASRADMYGSRAPHSYRSGLSGTGLSYLMGAGNEPDLSGFTFNPAMRQQAIEAGVTPLEASAVKQNAFLPNTGFFGRHPRLSAAIEGGMLSALASHGGNTPGESIQGVIEGIVGGQRVRRGLLNEQFAKPFEASNIMANLEDRQQRRDLQEADIQHLRALNEHLANGDDLKAQQLMETNRHQEAMEATRGTQLEATAPRNLGGGLYGYYDPSLAGTGKSPWHIQENPEAKMGRAAEGAGPWYQYKDPKSGKTKMGRVREGATVPEGAQFIQGTYEQKRGDKAVDARQKWIAAQSAKPGPIWMMAGIAPGEKNPSAKLGAFYDQQIAPSVQDSGGVTGTQDNPHVIP